MLNLSGGMTPVFAKRSPWSIAIFRTFGNLPRPDLWLPYVFTSPEEAAQAGLYYDPRAFSGARRATGTDICGTLIAFAELGDGEKAVELFRM
jgi:hypothetical protein